MAADLRQQNPLHHLTTADSHIVHHHSQSNGTGQRELLPTLAFYGNSVDLDVLIRHSVVHFRDYNGLQSSLQYHPADLVPVGHRFERLEKVLRHDHYGESVQGKNALAAVKPGGDVFRSDLLDDWANGHVVASLHVLQRQEHIFYQRGNSVSDAAAPRSVFG